MALGLWLELGWMVALGAWLLLSVILLVLIDIWRRLRALPSRLRGDVQSALAAARMEDVGPLEVQTATTEDVVGTVRTLQAQYTGRMDRLQDRLEATLARLDERGQDGPRLS